MDKNFIDIKKTINFNIVDVICYKPFFSLYYIYKENINFQ